MAATLALRNPPSFLGAAGQQHSARNDRLTFGALLKAAAGTATATPLAVTGGAVYGPPGTMGEVTLNSNTQITLNPARFVVPGGIDSKQGQYEAIHDQQDTMPVTAQDATLYRRAYLAVVVDDSETSGVASSGTTDRGTVQVIDGPLAAAPPAYPALTGYPNRLLLGEFYIPSVASAQGVTWTPYNPRTTTRGGILPVLDADTSTVPGNSGAPGLFPQEYRDHPTLGLQRWNGTAWITVTGLGFARAMMRQATAQTALAAGQWTAITMTVEDIDTHDGHSTAANTSRWTCPASQAGLYELSGAVTFGATPTGSRLLARLTKGGALITGSMGGGTYGGVVGDTAQTNRVFTTLAVGEYIELQGMNTGAWSTAVFSDDTSVLAVERVS
jgi:hypothetical protein